MQCNVNMLQCSGLVHCSALCMQSRCLSPELQYIRHDICQKIYTSTVSQILKFTREKAHKSGHFRLLIWNCGIFHSYNLINIPIFIYIAHFIMNLWLKWLKIPKQNLITLIELWDFTRVYIILH